MIPLDDSTLDERAEQWLHTTEGITAQHDGWDLVRELLAALRALRERLGDVEAVLEFKGSNEYDEELGSWVNLAATYKDRTEAASWRRVAEQLESEKVALREERDRLKKEHRHVWEIDLSQPTHDVHPVEHFYRCACGDSKYMAEKTTRTAPQDEQSRPPEDRG